MNTIIMILTGVIVLLLAIIVYLSFRLSVKNVFIATTIKKLAGIEKNGNMEELVSFMHELHLSSMYSSFLKDKLFSRNEALDFIYGDIEKMKVYIHYTRDENDARKIMSEGFRFEDSFHRTALPVSKDNLDLRIKHNERKLFGDYLILIGISDNLVNTYSGILREKGVRNFSFENVLTETPPQNNENSDKVFQLSPRFVKGYINYKTGEITRNPNFDPAFDSPAFIRNLEHLN